MYESYKEMSMAVGVKKPQEAQKSKNHLENEDSHQRPNCCVGQSPKVRGSSVLRLIVGSKLLRNRGFNDLRSGPRVAGQTVVRKGLAFSERVGQCASTQSFHALERPREVWAAW